MSFNQKVSLSIIYNLLISIKLDKFLYILSSTDFLVDMAQYGLNEFTYEEISKEEFLRRN